MNKKFSNFWEFLFKRSYCILETLSRTTAIVNLMCGFKCHAFYGWFLVPPLRCKDVKLAASLKQDHVRLISLLNNLQFKTLLASFYRHTHAIQCLGRGKEV